MQMTRAARLSQIFLAVAAVLVVRVTVAVVLNYVNYFPANFQSDFLSGRESYFAGPYQWAFYTHIVSGPFALITGLILMNDRIRLWFPRGHRYLGRVQATSVLLFVVPSGLWMSYYSLSGAIAGFGFASLGIATTVCTALGWRAALRRRFPEHRRWMWRTFLLLCSAVAVRMMGGIATVAKIEAISFYQLAAWISWLGPLAVFELCEFARQYKRKVVKPKPAAHSAKILAFHD